LYTIGPLDAGYVNPSDSAKLLELAASGNGGDFQVFMDKIMEKHGDKSLIYVSLSYIFYHFESSLWKGELFVQYLIIHPGLFWEYMVAQG